MGGLSATDRAQLRSVGIAVGSSDVGLVDDATKNDATVTLTEAEATSDVVKLGAAVRSVILPAPSTALKGAMLHLLNASGSLTINVDVKIAADALWGNNENDMEGVFILGNMAGLFAYCDGLKWFGYFMHGGHCSEKAVEKADSASLTKAEVSGNPVNGVKVLCKGENSTLTLPDLAGDKGAVGYVRIYNDATTDQKIHFKNKAGATKQVIVGAGKNISIRGRKQTSPPPIIHWWTPSEGVTVTDPT